MNKGTGLVVRLVRQTIFVRPLVTTNIKIQEEKPQDQPIILDSSQDPLNLQPLIPPTPIKKSFGKIKNTVSRWRKNYSENSQQGAVDPSSYWFW